MNNLALQEIFEEKPVIAFDEMVAYEHLWLSKTATVKTVSDLFRKNPRSLPSDLVGKGEDVEETRSAFLEMLSEKSSLEFGIFVHGTPDYPEQLRDAKNPAEVLYFQGDWSLAETEKSIAVVGARKVTDEGRRRTRRLVKLLVENDYTIVSGLAEGVDTAAHEAAIEFGGKTVAVVGTPITEIYPRSNVELHKKLVAQHLVISQVPILRYHQQDWRANRGFFPERNKTMSALTKATVIVEASDTSGTLIQARAAFYQKRLLFILSSCFDNPNISWPERFLKKGAIRVDDIKDILEKSSH